MHWLKSISLPQLAEEVGYVFYIDPQAPGTSIAYWGPQIKVGVPQPALNGDMDAYQNVESLSFNMDTESIRGISGLGMYALKLYYETAESKEGVRAFQEKRRPDFRNPKV